MNILAQLDPVLLERTLLEELAAAQPTDRPGSALILVPNARLATHLERRLLEQRRAWLGVEVLHFHALARRIYDEAEVAAPRLLSPRLSEALLRRVLKRHPDNEWGRFVQSRPRALTAVATALRDLREATVRPQALQEAAGDETRQQALAAIYQAWDAELQRLRASGWVDGSDWIAGALPHAAAFATRRQQLWLHGAYELIGIHAEMVRELDRGRSMRILFPVQANAPVSRYAERFLRTQLVAQDEPIEAIVAADGRRLPLAALYDEEARPTPVAAPRLTYRSAQGAAAEIKGAVRAALAAVRDGCPPSEIVIAARSLTPYEAALDEVFEQEDLPWTGSLSQPLRNHPAVHDLMLWIAVLDEGFPRRGTAELLRSPRIHWERLTADGAALMGERADRWSRAAGVVGGLTEWTTTLVEWAAQSDRHGERTVQESRRDATRAAERTAEAQRVVQALQRVHAEFNPDEARRWSEHAERIATWVDLAFADDDGGNEIWEEIAPLLDEMRSLETIVGDTKTVSFRELRSWFESAVDRSERTPHQRDNGGIRVLDLLQLRGITCRRLFLVGMNSGVFPRPPRPDPVLPDALRERLNRRGTPLPLTKDGLDEERLLLALALGAATEQIELTWQRADEAGRGRTPSLALRETARLSHGLPDLTLCTQAAVWHPSHPTQALEWIHEMAGMLSAQEERLLTALRSVGQPTELEHWYPELSSGLQMLRTTESFTGAETRFDGRIGAREGERGPLSVSAMETLARCPLQYFFGRVLRVREFDQEPAPFERTPREIGQHVHDLLERVYGTLRGEGGFVQPLARRIERAEKIVDEVWDEAWRALAQRLARRAPALWATQQARWAGAIKRFIREDLERIEENDWGVPQAEQRVDRELALGEGRSLHLVGRFDRSFGAEQFSVIGDYKTGKIKDKTDPTKILKANTLQVPLYWMLAGSNARVELIGVGPNHDPAETEREERLNKFEGLHRDLIPGFHESLRILTDLTDDGVYPLHDSSVSCGYCPYELACRHLHPPTLEREDQAADRSDFIDMKAKTKSGKSTLDAVRGKR